MLLSKHDVHDHNPDRLLLIMHTHQICHLFRHVRFFDLMYHPFQLVWLDGITEWEQEEYRVVKYKVTHLIGEKLEFRRYHA